MQPGLCGYKLQKYIDGLSISWCWLLHLFCLFDSLMCCIFLDINWKSTPIGGGQDDSQQRKGKFLGKLPKAKFLKVLKTASNMKTSKTCQQYNEMITAGNVHVRQATASVKRGNSSMLARKPTKAELLHSLQLVNFLCWPHWRGERVWAEERYQGNKESSWMESNCGSGAYGEEAYNQ